MIVLGGGQNLADGRDLDAAAPRNLQLWEAVLRPELKFGDQVSQ